MPKKAELTIANRARGGRKLGKAKPNTRGSKTKALTPKQEHFIAAYMVRGNASAAYRDSHPGCTRATASGEGPRLFNDPRINRVLKGLIAERKKRLEVKEQRILDTLAAKAFTAISDAFDGAGHVLEPHQMPRDVALAVKKLKRSEIDAIDVATGQSKVIGHTAEIEMHDAIAPLKLLGQHLNMFTERVEVTIGHDFASILNAARQRVIDAARAPIEGTAERIE